MFPNTFPFLGNILQEQNKNSGIVKPHYQNFSLNHYVIKEWYKVLKDYDFDDVMEKLVDHLSGDNFDEIPKAY